MSILPMRALAAVLVMFSLGACGEDSNESTETRSARSPSQAPSSSSDSAGCFDPPEKPTSARPVIKVYFTCAGVFDKAFVYRTIGTRGVLRSAILSSIAGPSAAEQALGMEGGFDPATKADVDRVGNKVIVNLDSRTFNSGVWDDVTGGAFAVKPLKKTLAVIDPAWTLDVRIDGERLCEFADGVVCPS